MDIEDNNYYYLRYIQMPNTKGNYTANLLVAKKYVAMDKMTHGHFHFHNKNCWTENIKNRESAIQ